MALTRTFTRPATSSAAMAVSGWGEAPVVRCSHDSKDSSSKKKGERGRTCL